MSDVLRRARETLGYDTPWDRAAVIDEAVLATQAQALVTDPDVHPEHYRWAMWRHHLTTSVSRLLDDARLDALLALDTHEATRVGPGFGHGVVLDIVDAFALTDAQRTRITEHAIERPLTAGIRATLLRKLAVSAR